MLSVPIFDDVVFRPAEPVTLKAPVGVSHSHLRVKCPPDDRKKKSRELGTAS